VVPFEELLKSSGWLMFFLLSGVEKERIFKQARPKKRHALPEMPEDSTMKFNQK
jgi:hypothetical protein